MTGLPADVIRVWERRYGVVEPVRDENGIRLYSDSDVTRLTRLRSATESGHAVGRVARLSDEELEDLIGSQPERADPLTSATVARIVDAIRRGEPSEAEQALSAASLMVDTRSLVLEIIAPALRETGALWEDGKLSVWQEHLLSWLVRNVTGSLMRTLTRSQQQDAILFATPPFELHEFGIALAALLAAARGRPTHNLGVNVPVEEVLDACRRLRPGWVVLAMTQKTVPRALALQFITELDARLPRKTKILLGGSLGAEIAEAVSSARVEGLGSLEEFDARLSGEPVTRT